MPDKLSRRAFTHSIVAAATVGTTDRSKATPATSMTAPPTGAVPLAAFLDPSSSDVGDAFRKAKLYCKNNGKLALEFPAGRFYANEELIVDLQGLRVTGNNTLAVQSRAGRGFFQVRASDAKISSFTLVNATERARVGGRFEGSPERDRDAAVYVADADNVEISDLRIRNFNNGVYLRGKTSGGRSERIAVRNVTTFRCDMGVLFRQQNTLALSHVRSHEVTAVQGIEPHGVYGSGAGGGNGTVEISDCTCTGNYYDSAFKLKKCTVSGGNLSSEDSEILIQLDECSGHLNGLTLINQRNGAARTTQAVHIIKSEGIQLENLYVRQSFGYNGKACRINGSPRTRLINVSVDAHRPDPGGESPFIVENGSDDSTILNARYHDAVPGRNDQFVFRVINSDRVGIIWPDVSGADRIVSYQGTSSDCFTYIIPQLLRSGFTKPAPDVEEKDRTARNVVKIHGN